MAAADEMVVFTRLNYDYVACRHRFPYAIDFDPTFALKETKDLLVDLYVRAVVVVRHHSRRMERKAAVVQPPAVHHAA